MDWLLTGNPVTVFQLVIAALACLAGGAACYALYRGLLRTRVEYGEMHPGNLRRVLWAVLFLIASLELLYIFRESLRFPAGFVLLLPAIVLLVFFAATRIKV